MSSDGPPPLPAAAHDDRRWAVLLHGSQLLGFVFPCAGAIAPFVAWRLKKATVPEITAHGIVVANWIYSYFLYLIVGFLLSGLIVGPVLCLIVVVCGVIFPVVGLVKAGRGETWKYPLSLPILRWLGVADACGSTATAAVTTPRLFDRLRLPLFSVALSVVFGVAPLLPSLIAGVVASWNGCTLHEGFPNPCVICGVDFGDTLYAMGICFWWALATLPLGLMTLIAGMLWMVLELLVPGRRGRSLTEGTRGGLSQPDDREHFR